MSARDPRVPSSENPNRAVITVSYPPHFRSEFSFDWGYWLLLWICADVQCRIRRRSLQNQHPELGTAKRA